MMMKEAEPPFWLVWNEDGDAPRMKQRTPDAAEAEARRLALLHPGKAFVVLAPTARYTHVALQEERFDANLYIPF
jgi:hypothetical protein